MDKKQSIILSIMLTLSMILLGMAGASPAAAEGNDTGSEMTPESLQSLLESDIESLSFTLEDGSEAEAVKEGGQWKADAVPGVISIAEVRISADGKTHTFNISEVGREISAPLLKWVDESVTMNSSIKKVSKVRIALLGDAPIEDAVLLLKDGTRIELGSGDNFTLEESYEAERLSEFQVTIGGNQYSIPLSDPNVTFNTLIIEPTFEEGQEVSGVKVESPEGNEGVAFSGVKLQTPDGVEVEAAKLVTSSLKPVLLEKKEAGVFLAGEEELNANDFVVLLLMIDGKEHTINLANRQYGLEADGFLQVSIGEEFIEAGGESSNIEKSGELPYTGAASNNVFYLTGLLVTFLGFFTLRRRNLNEE